MTRVVAVDAGHGRNTPGKRNADNDREWIFNDRVVQALIDRLNDYEDVAVIRLDDPTGKTDVPLQDRTNKANEANADILVSVHHNANTGEWGDWTGTETYHYPGSTKGRQLAQKIHPHVVNAYDLRDRGIKSANFHMLRASRMPAVLIEGGFMDSTIDIKKLRNRSVLKQAGINIANGIGAYFQLTRKSTSPNGKFYKVQIGAFSKKQNAEGLAKQAQMKGFDHYIAHKDGLYKVQIGAFKNKKNAETLEIKAKQAGFETYIAYE